MFLGGRSQDQLKNQIYLKPDNIRFGRTSALLLKKKVLGESIKFRIPEGQGGERRIGVMSATIVNMTRAQQAAYPDFYNVRTQDAITMYAQPSNFRVWRSQKWYPDNHPKFPVSDEVKMGSPPRDRAQ